MTKREKWLIGVLTALLVPTITGAAGSVQRWVRDVNDDRRAAATALAVQQSVQDEIKQRLVRIEDKLDRAIARQLAKLTRAQVRTAIRQAIDDPDGKRWTDANLDALATLMQDMMFESILDTFEFFTSHSEAVTPSSGSANLDNLAKRFYRMQRVIKVSDSTEYYPRLWTEAFPGSTYYLRGETVYTDPAITGSTNMQLSYSYLPTKFNALASDATTLPDYPEGHEMALVYLTAAAAMTKGDAESMQQIGRLADIAVEAMLTYIARRSPLPATSAQIARVKNALMRNPLVSAVSAG